MRSLGCPWHRNSGRFRDACVGAVCGREERGGGRREGEGGREERSLKLRGNTSVFHQELPCSTEKCLSQTFNIQVHIS